ncbi:unnamed protein product, partial [Choristocarpus tenellus]
EARRKTSFLTRDGKREFRILLYIRVGNALFISTLFSAFGPLWRLLDCLEDTVLASLTQEKHIHLIGRVLSTLQATDVALKPSKLQIGLKKITYL